MLLPFGQESSQSEEVETSICRPMHEEHDSIFWTDKLLKAKGLCGVEPYLAILS